MHLKSDYEEEIKQRNHALQKDSIIKNKDAQLNNLQNHLENKDSTLTNQSEKLKEKIIKYSTWTMNARK